MSLICDVGLFYRINLGVLKVFITQIAGEGFEPPTSGLWARRALQTAPSRYKNKINEELINLTILEKLEILKKKTLFFLL